MTPIRGLSEQRQLPRLGKIRLGLKVEGQKASYPRPTDFFVCPPEVKDVFGDEPRELNIMFPVEEEGLFASQWFKCYSATRGLICKGDGYTADRLIDAETGALADRTSKEVVRRDVNCQGQECPELQRKQCRPLLTLQFLLPDVEGLGIWQIDTSSVISIRNINSGLEMVRGLTGGRVAMLPLVLALGPVEVSPEGTKKKVYVLHLTARAKLADIQRIATLPASRVLLPPPLAPEDEEAPEELFPSGVIAEKEPNPDLDKALDEALGLIPPKVPQEANMGEAPKIGQDAGRPPSGSPEAVGPTDEGAGQGASPATPRNPATEAQRRAIFSISRSMGWADEEVKAVMVTRFQTEHTSMLSKREASDFIEWLRAGGQEPEVVEL